MDQLSSVTGNKITFACLNGDMKYKPPTYEKKMTETEKSQGV